MMLIQNAAHVWYQIVDLTSNSHDEVPENGKEKT